MSALRCEKCGSGEISMSYHAQGCTRPKCSCAECSYNSYNRKHEEHLHYVCCACRFDWIGPVLAAPATTLNEPKGEA